MELMEKLETAWGRVREDRRTDFLLGDFEYHAFHRYRHRLLQGLADKIAAQGSDYTPRPLRVLRVPKDSYTTRPGCVPEIDDRIFYQSLVDDLAHEVEGNLSPLDDGVLHSYRYKGERAAAQMFHQEEASYRTFFQRTRQLGETHSFVVVTDIATFYERIYHHELENTLRGLGGDPSGVEQVMNLLRKWRKGSSYGIPQGIWPSDYLGNLYLDPVDKYMARAGFDLCRYVDDIRLGADSYVEAQRILLLLEERLAPFGLALSGAKTLIVPADQLEESLFPYKPRFDEIFEELRGTLGGLAIANPYDPSPDEIEELEETVQIESARRLFREELQERDPNPSVARFCLGTFKRFIDADMLDDVLDGLTSLAQVAPRVVAYLGTIAKRADRGTEIRRALSRFVEEEESTVFDWQRMWMLQALDRIGDLDPRTDANVRNILMRRHSLHEAVVVQALLLVGRHGDDADRNWMLQLYDEQHSWWVKRAILFAIRHLDKAKRNHFYKYCRGEDSMTDAVIDYAKSETP